MANKVLAAFVAIDFLFLFTGCIMLGFCLIVQNDIQKPIESLTDGQQVARHLLYSRFPLTAGIVASVFIFVTFVTTLPGITTPTRGWLKFSAYLISFNALFTMCLGVFIWILTLKTRDDFAPIYGAQTMDVQKLMQTRFNCCGYFDSNSPAFQTNPTCPSQAAAALMRGCAAPISSFANSFIDHIFTAVFGFCGIDGILILALACLLKDRKERERFRHIDEKSGFKSATF